MNLSLGKVLRRFDMRCLDYARPLGDVGFDAHGKLSRRVHNWLETERGHLALRVERPDGVRDRLVELGNDRLWRPSQDENTALLRCLTCQLWPRPDFPVRIPTRCLPVSFNGSAPAIQSVLGGHTGLAFTVITPAVPYVKDGALRGLAVTTPKRPLQPLHSRLPR